MRYDILSFSLNNRFFISPDDTCSWELVSNVRKTYPTDDDFNKMLKKRLSLVTDTPLGD